MLKRDDFVNANEVRWCPGCGDYAILAGLQKTLPELGLNPEQHVFVSGIGCAGRLPYYMNCYGFHTIHGRATAVASGLKLMRDDLSVWVITGDGDALSIGATHFIHLLRRNINVNILMFNNQVYGLTKGQFSPTSPMGQVSKTTPRGSNQQPINPVSLALSAGASFVARGVDKDPQHLGELFKAAHAHPGTSFIEIYQDCNIFNLGAFDAFSLKANRQSHTLLLQDNAALQFGSPDAPRGIVRDGDILAVSDVSERVPLMVHDVRNKTQAHLLAGMHYPDYPVPLGVFYQEERTSLQAHKPVKAKQRADLEALYRSKATWVEN